MRVRVKLFATLVRELPQAKPGIPFEVELPEGAKVQDLVEVLKLPATEVKSVFVNGRSRSLDWALSAGDEVGIFPPIGGGTSSEVAIEVWLYGPLAAYAGEASQGSFASLKVRLPAGSTMADLLEELKLPAEERGNTFINGQLSAMPGLAPDLEHVLQDGDRVGIFHTKSMWPFQYRHGAALSPGMERAMAAAKDRALRHDYRRD